MGIDFGSKRVGVALSDETGTMAFPHDVYQNDAQLAKTIADLIEAKGVAEVVVGHSLDRDGQANAIHAAAEAFIGELTLQLPVPIHFEPEQYSTQEALRIQGRTEKTDAAAAAIILNSFLMKQS